MEEARLLDHNYVGSEHVLLGLLRDKEGVAAQVLMNLGVTLERVRREVRALLGQEETDMDKPADDQRSSPTAETPQQPHDAKPQVAIADFISDDLEPERSVLGDVAEVTALGALDEEELVGRIEQADAIILYHEVTLTGETIERLEQCKLIVRGGVGFDNVDRAVRPRAGHPRGQRARLRLGRGGRLGDRRWR